MKTIIIARGQTFEEQHKQCMEFALKRGYDVVAVTDSIYNVFQPILNNEVDIILTTDISRITRKENEFYKIKEVLNNNAVDLVIAEKPPVEYLSYDATIEVLRNYGRKIYKKLYVEGDALFAGKFTKDILKDLKENPFGDKGELLDQQARYDYFNGRV